MTMLQMQLLEPGRVELREVPMPEPGPGELVLRVDAALTCGTDLKLYRRGHPKLRTPAPFGHELSGTVVAVGRGAEPWAEGDEVALVPTAPCGQCKLCARGRDSLCPDAIGRVMLGAFAEYVRVPEHIVQRHVFPRSPYLTAAEAAVLEPLACVVHGASRVALNAAERVTILGDGAIALLFAQLARLRGASHVLVLGKHDHRLALVRATTGAETARVDAGPGLGGGADVVIECVGVPETWRAAAALAGPGAEVLLFGGCAAGTTATFDTHRIHYDEVDLKGAFHYGTRDVAEAMELLASRAVRAAPLITHVVPLTELEHGLELAASRRAMKVAVLPRNDPSALPPLMRSTTLRIRRP